MSRRIYTSERQLQVLQQNSAPPVHSPLSKSAYCEIWSLACLQIVCDAKKPLIHVSHVINVTHTDGVGCLDTPHASTPSDWLNVVGLCVVIAMCTMRVGGYIRGRTNNTSHGDLSQRGTLEHYHIPYISVCLPIVLSIYCIHKNPHLRTRYHNKSRKRPAA